MEAKSSLPQFKFESESEVEEKRRNRQEEWARVRQPDQPIEAPPEELEDTRCLDDRLEEQKGLKQADHDEKYQSNISSPVIANPKVTASTPSLVTIQSKRRTSQSQMLVGAVKRKRSSSESNYTQNGNISNTKAQDEECDESKLKQRRRDWSESDTGGGDIATSEGATHDGMTSAQTIISDGAAVVVGVLPGIGVYTDSDNSDTSSSDSDIDIDFFKRTKAVAQEMHHHHH